MNNFPGAKITAWLHCHKILKLFWIWQILEFVTQGVNVELLIQGEDIVKDTADEISVSNHTHVLAQSEAATDSPHLLKQKVTNWKCKSWEGGISMMSGLYSLMDETGSCREWLFKIIDLFEISFRILLHAMTHQTRPDVKAPIRQDNVKTSVDRSGWWRLDKFQILCDARFYCVLNTSYVLCILVDLMFKTVCFIFHLNAKHISLCGQESFRCFN